MVRDKFLPSQKFSTNRVEDYPGSSRILKTRSEILGSLILGKDPLLTFRLDDICSLINHMNFGVVFNPRLPVKEDII